MGMLEGWKQIAEFFRVSERQARRLIGAALDSLPHWHGPKSRLKLTQEEALRLKREARKLKVRKMSDGDRRCPTVSD